MLPRSRTKQRFHSSVCGEIRSLGISRGMIDELDFVIIPTTHLHMKFTLPEDFEDTPESKALGGAPGRSALKGSSFP